MGVLSARPAALDYQGFMFRDTATGALVERRVLDLNYRLPERLTATTHSVVQLPTHKSDEAIAISHSLQTSEQASEILAGIDLLEERMEKMAADLNDQTAGLIPGHVYKIGLRTDLSFAHWWCEGNKAEVFLRGSRSRRFEGEPLQMELVNKAEFNVVI